MRKEDIFNEQRIVDAKVLVGGAATAFALADIQVMIGILVGIATLIYVSLGIYGRYKAIKENKPFN